MFILPKTIKANLPDAILDYGTARYLSLFWHSEEADVLNFYWHSWRFGNMQPIELSNGA